MRSIVLTCITIVLAVACSSCRHGESGDMPLVYADPAEYDAGMIADSVRMLSHTFYIHNNTGDTCHIERVERTCGCIATDLTSTTIPPGDSVHITMNVQLDQSIYIDKEVYVYTSLQKEPVTLYITAIRKMSEDKMLAQFTYPIGSSLRLPSDRLSLGYSEQGKLKSATMDMVNAGKETVTLDWKMENQPNFLTIDVPAEIRPGETGRINVVTDLSNPRDVWGEQEFILMIGEKGSTLHPLKIITIITPDLTENGDGTFPQLLLPVHAYRISDSERQKKDIEKHFDLVNTGNGTLTLNYLKASNSSAKIKTDAKEVKPNSKVRLYVSIPVTELKKDSVIKVGITTNERKNPYREVRVFY